MDLQILPRSPRSLLLCLPVPQPPVLAARVHVRLILSSFDVTCFCHWELLCPWHSGVPGIARRGHHACLCRGNTPWGSENPSNLQAQLPFSQIRKPFTIYLLMYLFTIFSGVLFFPRSVLPFCPFCKSHLFFFFF